MNILKDWNMFTTGFILAIFLFIVPSSLSAQQLKGTWTKTLVCRECLPNDIAFADSNSGVVVANNEVFLTGDGGATFRLTNANPGAIDPIPFRSTQAASTGFFACFSRMIGLYFSYSDGGYEWSFYRPNFYVEPPTPITGAVPFYFFKMLSYSEGLFLLDTKEEPPSPHQFYLYNFNDSLFSPLGSTISGLNVTDGQASSAGDLFAVTDPDGFYPSQSVYSYGNRNMSIAHSADSGKYWTYSSPIDTNSWKGWMSFAPMEKGYGDGHFFLTGGRVTDTLAGERNMIDDYVETTDDGSTWNTVNSVSGGRVFRIANPAPNVLWVAVGRVPNVPKLINNLPINYDTETYKGTPVKFVDSMFVSVNGGKTWTKDGTTFAGDTICAMRWLSAANGYVITYRDTDTYIYHFTGSIDSTKSYVPAQTSGQSGDFQNHPVNLSSFPDPANDYVHVNIPDNDGIRGMRIFDILEREVSPATEFANGVLTIDVKSFSAGSYFMQIQGASGRDYLARFSSEP